MLIGEVSKVTGLSKDTIRFYTRMGIVRAEKRPAGNTHYAEYSEQSVEFLKQIQWGKSVGFTLQEMQALAPSAYEGTLSDDELKVFFEQKLLEIRNKLVGLQLAEQMLVDKLKKLESV